MKKFITGIVIFSSSAALTLSSCKKDDSINTTTPSSAIQNDPSLTIFAAIQNKSGDATLINAGGTVLAPVDSAFANAGITATVAAALSPATCDSILRYYTIPAGVNFNTTINNDETFASALTPLIYGDSTATAVYFNGTPSTTITPLIAGKATIYKLTQFINLPVTNVAKIYSSDTALTMFAEAFNRTGISSNLTGTAYTLFMPTNAAFIAAGYPDIASIDAVDITTLTNLLMYHIVSGRLFFINDLMQQASLSALQGSNIQVATVSGIVQLSGNSDPLTPATIIKAGILGGNVLGYKINEVLMP